MSNNKLNFPGVSPMKHALLTTALCSALVLSFTPTNAEIDFGADMINRYVWRGTDFGNVASIQPAMSYSTGAIEIGAWSSWAIDGGGANENDLYVSFGAGPVGITITDYYFPGLTANDMFFSYGDGDAIHILEASASFAIEDMPIRLMAAFNFSGDSEHSIWIESTYDVGEIDATAVSATIGAGNGAYTTNTDPRLVSAAINLSKGGYFASYILNPDRKSTFMIFGKSF